MWIRLFFFFRFYFSWRNERKRNQPLELQYVTQFISLEVHTYARYVCFMYVCIMYVSRLRCMHIHVCISLEIHSYTRDTCLRYIQTRNQHILARYMLEIRKNT